jgi:ribosomal protein S18 acetylase RimI-like enzyme
MVLAYRLPHPTPGDIDGLCGMPELVRPMVELEHEMGGSYYVNALAVRREFRGRGIGTRLLRTLIPRARHAGCTLMSVGVFSENTGALRLYLREGFEVVGERPVVAHPCYTRTDRTLMLAKPV